MRLRSYIESGRFETDAERIDRIANRIAWIATIILGTLAIVYGFKFLTMDGRLFQ